MAVKAGTAYVGVEGDFSALNRQVSSHFSKLSKQAGIQGKKAGGSFRHGLATGVTAGAKVAAVGMGALAAEIVHATKGWSEHVAIQRRSAATIKSTGNAARVTAKHVENLSDKIEKQSGIDGDLIQSGANLLLTFTNIRNGVGKNNKVFDQATGTIANMSKALGQDTKSSAIQLGKALNDPVKGISALSRVGVSFTTQQKEQIKSLAGMGNAIDNLKLAGISLDTKQKDRIKTLGDLADPLEAAKDLNLELTDAQKKQLVSMQDGTGAMQAQKIILKELGREFPKVKATPFERLQTVGRKLEDTIGRGVLPVFNKFLKGILPGLEHLSDRFDDIFSNKKLSFGEKIKQAFAAVKVEAAPLVNKIINGILHANLPQKLGQLLDRITSSLSEKVGDKAGEQAPTFLDKFIEQIRKAGLGKKLGALLQALGPKIQKGIESVGGAAAEALWNGFKDAPTWAKVGAAGAGSAFLLKALGIGGGGGGGGMGKGKVGGAFSAAGSLGAKAFKTAFEAGAIKLSTGKGLTAKVATFFTGRGTTPANPIFVSEIGIAGFPGGGKGKKGAPLPIPAGGKAVGAAEEAGKVGRFGKVGKIAAGVGGAAAGLLPFALPEGAGAAIAGIGAAAAAAAAPIAIVVGAIAAIGGAAYLAYTKIKPFHDFIDKAWDKTKQAVTAGWGAIKNAFGTGVQAVSGFLQQHKDDWNSMWNAIKAIAGALVGSFKKVVGAIGAVFRAVWPVIQPVIKFIGDNIVGAFRRAIQGVVQVFSGIGELLGGVVDTIGALLRGDFRGMWNGIKEIFKGGRDMVVGVLRTMTAPVREIGSRIGRALVGGFRGALDALRSAGGWIWNRIRAAVAGSADIAAKIGAGIWRGIRTGFHTAISTVGDVGKWIWDKLSDAVHGVGTMLEGIGKRIAEALWRGIKRIGGTPLKIISKGIDLVFAQGGPVPGAGSGDHVRALLTPGEHVWTKQEVERAGGHQAMYAMRAAYGGGGQSIGPRMAEGGAAFSAGSITVDFKGQLGGFSSSWRGFWNTLLATARRGAGDVEARFRAMRVNTTASAERMYRDVRQQFAAVEKSADARGRGMASQWKGSWDHVEQISYEALNYVAHETNQALKGFGINVVHFGLSAPGKRKGAQRGWYVPGQGTGDKVPAMLEPGEYVVNRKAVQRFGKGRLDQLNFGDAPRFQGGGIVPIPGQPGMSISSSILGDVMKLINQYKLRVTAGYAPTGHASGGEHPLGLALDLVPGAGGSWGLVNRLAHRAEPSQNHPVFPFRWVGWNGDSGHGDPAHAGSNAHLHLSWLHGASGIGGIANLMTKIAAQTVTGPDGAMKDIIIGAERTARKAANSFLGRQSAVGENETGGASGALSKLQLKLLWTQAGGPSNVANTAAAIALAESGGIPSRNNADRPGDGGHSIAAGLWQILGLPFAGNAYDPLTNARMAVSKYRSAGGFSPWEAFTKGSYRAYLKKGGGVYGPVSRLKKKTPKVPPTVRQLTKAFSKSRKLIDGIHRVKKVTLDKSLAKRVTDRIGKIGFTEEQAGLTKKSREADKFADWAQRAADITDTDKLQDALNRELVNRGAVGGMSDTQMLALFPPEQQDAFIKSWKQQNATYRGGTDEHWLNEEVGALLTWRNQMINDLYTGNPTLNKMKGNAVGQWKGLHTAIRETMGRINRFTNAREKVTTLIGTKKRLKDDAEKDLKDELKKPAKKRSAKRIANLRERIAKYGAEEAALRHGSDRDLLDLGLVKRDAKNPPFEHSHAWYDGRLKQMNTNNNARKTAATTLGGDDGTDGWPTQWGGTIGDIEQAIESVASSLDNVHGIGSVRDVFTDSTQFAPGVLGGTILSVQRQITDLTANALRASGSELVAPPGESDAAQAELLKKLLSDQTLRAATSEAQYDVFRNLPGTLGYPFGGSFKEGGMVPGPYGAPRMILAHGGEVVVPNDANYTPGVTLQFANGMEWLKQFVSIQVDNQTRAQGRRGERQLPGRAGTLR